MQSWCKKTNCMKKIFIFNPTLLMQKEEMESWSLWMIFTGPGTEVAGPSISPFPGPGADRDPCPPSLPPSSINTVESLTDRMWRRCPKMYRTKMSCTDSWWTRNCHRRLIGRTAVTFFDLQEENSCQWCNEIRDFNLKISYMKGVLVG